MTRFALVRGVCCAVLALAGAARAATEALSAGADVVVLCGLPGDVESEKEYHDQLERLLRVLGEPAARPRRLFVLTDEASTLKATSGVEAEVAAATREGVLDLARRLAARPDAPLV